MRWAVTQKAFLVNDVLHHSPYQLAILTSWYWVCRSPCVDFLPPSSGVFRLSHLGVIAGYPMQTVMRLSRYGAGFGNKKSPHNNLNLTIPSGIALVRVRYVAIRKSKTCSDSFGSRAGTLSKYVILNCWNRLPQNRAVSTKRFENTPLSAGCKKRRWKLWQKERGLDGISPLWVIMPLEDKMHSQRNFVRNIGFGRSPTSVLKLDL